MDNSHTRQTLRTYAQELLLHLYRDLSLQALFPQDRLADILHLEVVDQEPRRGGIYDISLSERKIFFSDHLLSSFQNYWDQHTLDSRDIRNMCFLYYLHELKHVEQKVDSDTYPFSSKSVALFGPLDYVADAFAVDTCFRINNRDSSNWQSDLCEVLRAHIWGGEVFATVDMTSGADNIEGGRLQRQLIWFFQYARASLFATERPYEQFDLFKSVVLELFAYAGDAKENLCVKPKVTADDLVNLEMHVLCGQKRYIFGIQPKVLRDSLKKALWERDLDAAIDTFRPLFNREEEMVGRGNPRHHEKSIETKGSDRDDSGEGATINTINNSGLVQGTTIVQGREISFKKKS